MQISPDEIRSALDRICRSQTFAHAERLRAFLSFVIHERLSGRGDQLKEYVIACQVCGRAESFDPKLDAIVRGRRKPASHAPSGLPRKRGPERSDSDVLPKGTYAPVFERCSAVNTGSPLARSLAVLPFVNLGTVGEEDYFSDSVTEELIHALARLP